jgi:dihydrofolate synthase/folylpolyglutamate synthase
MSPPSEALAWLDSTQRFGIKLGLENTQRLLAAAGNPEAALRIIHVAGTNGKGSVCAIADSILRQAGLRTGLYTSPHLVDFRERIRVDGEKIPPETLDRILFRLKSLTARWEHTPTFFEVSTVAALIWFCERQVDVVVLETGMGGRLDATNAVTPLVSVITSIGLDHQEWLGTTLGAIAGEKAGIIKPGIPVISSPQKPEAECVIATVAQQRGAPLSIPSPLPQDVPLALIGTHQRQNAALAIAAIHAARLSIASDAIARGLAEVQWPGRFQRCGNFWLDGAHNPDGARVLKETWRAEFGDTRAQLIFGALAEKGIRDMLAELSEISESAWIVPIQNPRSESPQGIAAQSAIPTVCWSSLSEAIDSASRLNRPVLIAGSLFLVGEALEILRGQQS